jgi:hypothetical protein
VAVARLPAASEATATIELAPGIKVTCAVKAPPWPSVAAWPFTDTLVADPPAWPVTWTFAVRE